MIGISIVVTAESEINDVACQYKAGTLIIDLIDAGQKRLVWRGIAEGELQKKDQKDLAATIERAVTGIFGKFAAT